MEPRIAIAIGDAAGIGPEVTLKAVAQEWTRSSASFLLLGDPGLLGRLNRRLGCPLSPAFFEGQAVDPRLEIRNALGTVVGSEPAAGSSEAAQAAIAWLREGVNACQKGMASALVTAPVNKESIIRAGVPFVGQTEFLSELTGQPNTCMMLLGSDERDRWLRVALVTTHVPLRHVADRVTAEKVGLAIRLAEQACRDLSLPRARIGVCGLNPHAGEGGQMGTEEQTLIEPVVRSVRGQGVDVVGPLAADSLFYFALRGEFDAVVAMYHDQGLVPLKMIGFETGVNWTLGLPIIRTSPDHGTAYDIAGRGVANASSMVSAIRLASQLVQRRKS